MTSRSWKLTVAIVATAACVSPVASAQEATTTPPTSVPPTTMPAPTTTQPPGYTIPTVPSTTATTAAEYSEMYGSERERSIRPNRPMLATGASLLVVPYVAGAILGARSSLPADKKNFIPVAGPWLNLAERPCSFGGRCSMGDRVGSALLVGSGIAQGVGLAMTAASFIIPEKETEHVPPKAAVKVVPMSLPGGGGIGAVGTF